MNKISRFGSFFIILLSACGNLSVTLPTDTPIPTLPTVTAAETATPTVTETPSLTETPTQTATPTETLAPAEPGTMVLDSEYNLGSKIEIIPENSAPFYNYLMTALHDDNPLYFQAHPELGVTAGDFINYIKTHDSILAGLKIPTAYGDGSYFRLSEIQEPVNLKKVDLMVVNLEQYKTLKANPPEWFNESDLLFSSSTDPIKIGYFVKTENGIGNLTVAVVQTVVGNEQIHFTAITEPDLQLANGDIDGLVYVTKGFHAESPNDMVDIIPPNSISSNMVAGNYSGYSYQTQTFSRVLAFELASEILDLKGKVLRVPLPPEIVQLSGK